MANQLKMAMVQAIIGLLEQGWSYRRIARELGVHRETVARYDRLRRTSVSKPANPTLGSDQQDYPKPANATPGSIPPGYGLGPPSFCQPFEDVIKQKLDQNLSGQRIWQDLADEHGFNGSYSSVKRYVRRLGGNTPLPFRRMECDPGQEGQVDFGSGAWIINDGHKRRPHVLRIVLSHSRKSYSEAVYKQSTENFIRVLENAFHSFGGVPRTLVIDNLKAAVTKADWYDPELNPKIVEFARHYGFVFLPTRPYMPRHKGKVESGVKYVKNNALKGRSFTSLAEHNQFLARWERQVADTRIHGTTRQQVARHFKEVEQKALLPLPEERFPFYSEGKRKVNRDGHIEVARAYYSTPPEYLGRSVWARWDGRRVWVFDDRMQAVAEHLRVEPGRFSTHPQHIADRKISGIERGAAWMLNQVSRIGPRTNHWAEAMLKTRGIEGVRVLQGLMSMTYRHTWASIEKACEVAHSRGAYRLRDVRQLIERGGSLQEQFEFAQEHPIIRSLAEYGEFVHTAWNKESS